MKVLSCTDAAYIAGIIDGEGTISVNRTNTSSSAKGCKRGYAYRSSVRVGMTDLPILEWLQNTCGIGMICKKKSQSVKHKQSHTWSVWSKEAVELLHQIIPYLHIKHKQARNLIIFQNRMRSPGIKGLSDEEWNFRFECYSISKELNRRGVI